MLVVRHAHVPWGVVTPHMAAKVRRKHSSTYGWGGIRACPRRKPKDVCESHHVRLYQLPDHQLGERGCFTHFQDEGGGSLQAPRL